MTNQTKTTQTMKIFTPYPKTFDQTKLMSVQTKRDIGDMKLDRLLETFSREADIIDLLETEVAVFVPTNFGLLKRGWHRLSVPNIVTCFDRDYHVYIDSRLTWAGDSISRSSEYTDFIELYVAAHNRKRFRSIIAKHFFFDTKSIHADMVGYC